MALLSIHALYNYDSSIFSGLSVPEHIDKQNVIDTIVLECAELELLYSDPEMLQAAIATWSAVHLPEWNALQETLEYDYNPIWNVDANETETRTRIGNRESAGENIEKVTGYNENTATEAARQNATGNEEYGETEILVKERGGNVGVTMTQQLIEAQRKVVQFNVTDIIVKQFKMQFCIMLY